MQWPTASKHWQTTSRGYLSYLRVLLPFLANKTWENFQWNTIDEFTLTRLHYDTVSLRGLHTVRGNLNQDQSSLPQTAVYWTWGCVLLGWCASKSVIKNHSDHCASKNKMNPLWSRIHLLIWCPMIRVIHKSWSRSPQSNKQPFVVVPAFSGGRAINFQQDFLEYQ